VATTPVRPISVGRPVPSIRYPLRLLLRVRDEKKPRASTIQHSAAWLSPWDCGFASVRFGLIV
jgi:hypothetical protein